MKRLAIRVTTLASTLATTIATLLSSPAHAHTGVDHVHSLTAGMLHPLLGADHLLAMVLVGAWAALAGGARIWVWPAMFVAGMVAGGVMGASGLPMPHMELAIAASVLLLGGLAALMIRAPLLVGAVLIAAFGAAHGFAHGAEAPAGSFAGYALGFVVVTAALHLGGVFAVRLAGATLSRVAAAVSALIGLSMVLS